MKILVTGDRNWSSIDVIVEVLQRYSPETVLIHGACDGADNMSAAIAEALGFTIRSYPADWAQFGKAAGPIRNQRMITNEHFPPDDPITVCFAFHDNLSQSRGTKDMIARVERAKIPWRIISSKGDYDCKDNY